VTYLDLTTRDLKYATCASGCGLASRWHSASVDTTGQVGLQSSVAVEGGGRVHATYRDVSNGSLKYATCAGDCANAANWRFAIVGAGSGTIEANGAKAPSAEGAWSSLAVDADGRLHVAYQEFASDDLRYATCLGDCADGANWQRLTVSSFGNVGEHASLAVGPDGRLHVMYFDGTDGALEYATCPGDCTVAANWSVRTVDSSAPLTGPWASLEVDANGRLHVSYYDGTNRDLKYATCATGCGTLENWQIITADSAGDVGKYSSLAIDSGGRIHISYLDDATDDLRYLW
jgi:hypothetical protein